MSSYSPRSKASQKDKVKRKVSGKFGFRSIILSLAMVATLVFGCLGRVAYIMTVKGEQYRKIAANNQLRDTVIPGIRGIIYDRNGEILAENVSAWLFCADPYKIKKAFKDTGADIEKCYEYLSKNIAEILSVKKDDVYFLIKETEGRRAQIKKNLTSEKRQELEEFLSKQYTLENGKILQPLQWFFYENSTKRVYPYNNLASTLIGVVSADGDGQSGLEKYYNDLLKGENGKMMSLRDSRGNELSSSSFETVVDPTEGNGLVLTIDKNIQLYLENALQKALINTKADSVYGIMLDVDTGAVLALSDKPDFDLNNPRVLGETADLSVLDGLEKGTEEYSAKYSELLLKQWNSFCITSNYEPGSTFKIFTLAAALESGVVSEKTGHTCTSSVKVADTVYHCANHKAHGTQTLREGLMNSCNTFFITVGQRLGLEKFNEYFTKFGFRERTGIDAAGESISIVHKADKMSIVDLASTSFGQSVRLTPLQIITAASALANGGKLMKPYLVDSVVDSNGKLISKTQPTVRRQVISESTSKTVCSMMESVVEGGTGKNAYIPGYRVAGKTATAQKLDSSNINTYIASFLCFAPADDPKVAILVGIDNPKGMYSSGGVLAAPVAKEVMENTLSYLGVEPSYSEKELETLSSTAPDLVGKTVAQAKNSAYTNNITVKVVGSGEKIVSQYPLSGQTLPKGGVLIAYTDGDTDEQKAVVPSFTGLTVSESNIKASECGINIIFSGPMDDKGLVCYAQSVGEGTALTAGESVTVYFRNNDISD